MTRVFTTLVLLSCFLGGYSQYWTATYKGQGNPGQLNTTSEYPVGSGLDAGWTSILTGGLTTPQWSGVRTIPFPFEFNGNTVTEFKVSSSGVLTFNVGHTDVPPYQNASIPNSQIPDNSVVIWGLAGTGGNDEITVRTFGTAPNRQHWVFFTSYTFAGGNPSNCWTYWSIVLEETTNNIYIVDQRNGGLATCAPKFTVGIQIDNMTALSIPGSPNLAPRATTDPTPDDNVYYAFYPGTQPSYDLAARELTTPLVMGLDQAPLTISALFQNYGSVAVSDFVFHYEVEGTTYSSQITNPVVDGDGYIEVNHPIEWTPSGSGPFTVKLWASDINGQPDQRPENDTITGLAIIASQTVAKKPLVEKFTSATCGPCASFAAYGDTILWNMRANHPDGQVNAIKYQMNWPSPGNDPFYNQDGLARRGYYSVNATPSGFINGKSELGHRENILKAGEQLAFIDLDIDFTVTNNVVNVEVTVNPLVDIPIAGLRLHIAIVEDSIYYSGGTTSQRNFYQIMRKMLPSGTGTLIGPLTEGVPVTISQSHTFSIKNVSQNTSNIFTDMSNISVVAFVQDEDSDEIFQSAAENSSFECPASTVQVGVENGTTLKADISTNVSYQWYTCNSEGGFSPIAGQTGQTFTPLVSGEYAVSVIENNTNTGCPNISSCVQFFMVGIEEVQQDGMISVLPNPATSNIQVVLPEKVQQGNWEIAVFSISGERKAMNLLNHSTGQVEINVSDLPAGMYIIQVKSDCGVYNTRFMKQ